MFGGCSLNMLPVNCCGSCVIFIYQLICLIDFIYLALCWVYLITCSNPLHILTFGTSMNNELNVNRLKRYLLTECRVILLHTIGKDYKKFAGLHGINYTAVHNFVKWSYNDYINNRDKSKQFRYLSTDNCIRILELSGYEIRLSLVLKNDTENEV